MYVGDRMWLQAHDGVSVRGLMSSSTHSASAVDMSKYLCAVRRAHAYFGVNVFLTCCKCHCVRWSHSAGWLLSCKVEVSANPELHFGCRPIQSLDG